MESLVRVGPRGTQRLKEQAPLLLADFNNWTARDLLVLGEASIHELEEQGYTPIAGLRIRAYEPDFDADDLPDYLVAQGLLEKHAAGWALRGTWSHISDTAADHWSRQIDWDDEDRHRGLEKRLPGQTGLWASGAMDPTLDQCVNRLAELLRIWARERKRRLPAWTRVLVTEEVNGIATGAWHDVSSFMERFEWIRHNAARDWVNLHAAEVADGVLRCVVEYRTDGRMGPEVKRYVNLSGPVEAWWRSLPEVDPAQGVR